MLVGTGAINGLGVCLELLPPSGRQLRAAFRLRMSFTVRLGVPAPLQFGRGFPGCVPGGMSVGGPLLVSGVLGLKAPAFGGQLRGEGGGAGRTGAVVPGLGVCG
jgi:hypothetical protein